MPERFRRPIKVLYVDDDMALVRLAQRVLGRQGFDLVHAKDSEEALSKLHNMHVHVVALDHYLPDGTGLELLSRLKELEAKPAVVYVTGSSELSVAVAALKEGASDFVPKTVGDDFLVLLASALEQAFEKSLLQAEKEQAERELRIAKDRAEVLLKEVNHRVANSLSLVASLVSLQASAITDSVAKNALNETQSRIYAISMVHKRLYSSSDVRFVALNEYLAGLLEHLQISMHDQWKGATLKAELDALLLRTDQSISLGIVVAEWVTNSCKYAYPGGTGEIRVRLRRLSEQQAQLSVEDDGVGREEDGSVKGTGLGTRIVRAMAQSMNATVEYTSLSPGTAARLIFPVLEQPTGREGIIA